MNVAGLELSREGLSRRLRQERIRAVASGILALGPLALVVYYVASNAVDVPYYDQWAEVPDVDGWLTGTLRFASLFARHDGHVAVLAKLATVFSATWFRWNVLFEIWLGFLFLTAATALISSHAVADHESTALSGRLLGLVPLTAALFSLRQWENLLAPWAVGFFGSAFFALLCCYALQKQTLAWRLLGFGSALVATASMTNGLLVWLIVPAQLLLQGLGQGKGVEQGTKRTRGLPGLVAWIIAGGVVWGLYLLTGPTPVAGGPVSLRLGLERFIVVAGLALSPDKAVVAGGALQAVNVPIDAAACAAFGLGCAFVWAIHELWRRGRLATNSFAVSVALFGLGSMAMLAFGRAYLGIGQVLSSRYSTASSLFLVGVLLLLRSATLRQPSNWVSHGLIGLVIASNLIAGLAELQVGPFRRGMMLDWARTVRAFRTATDAQLQNPHFSPEDIRLFSAALERHHLSLFAGHSAPEDDLVTAGGLWARDSAPATASGKPQPDVRAQPVGDRKMMAVTFAAPARYRVNHVHVDPGDTLTFAYGMPSDLGDGARVVVEAISADKRAIVFEKLVKPRLVNGPIEWQTASVPLESVPGRSVDISFGIESPTGDSVGDEVAFGAMRIGR